MMKQPEQADQSISSPMPGKVLKILATEGESVEKGQSVFVVESMKMLHELRVPNQGKVTEISVKVGDVVSPKHRLASIVSGE